MNRNLSLIRAHITDARIHADTAQRACMSGQTAAALRYALASQTAYSHTHENATAKAHADRARAAALLALAIQAGAVPAPECVTLYQGDRITNANRWSADTVTGLLLAHESRRDEYAATIKANNDAAALQACTDAADQVEAIAAGTLPEGCPDLPAAIVSAGTHFYNLCQQRAADARASDGDATREARDRASRALDRIKAAQEPRAVDQGAALVYANNAETTIVKAEKMRADWRKASTPDDASALAFLSGDCDDQAAKARQAATTARTRYATEQAERAEEYAATLRGWHAAATQAERDRITPRPMVPQVSQQPQGQQVPGGLFTVYVDGKFVGQFTNHAEAEAARAAAKAQPEAVAADPLEHSHKKAQVWAWGRNIRRGIAVEVDGVFRVVTGRKRAINGTATLYLRGAASIRAYNGESFRVRHPLKMVPQVSQQPQSAHQGDEHTPEAIRAAVLNYYADSLGNHAGLRHMAESDRPWAVVNMTAGLEGCIPDRETSSSNAHATAANYGPGFAVLDLRTLFPTPPSDDQAAPQGGHTPETVRAAVMAVYTADGTGFFNVRRLREWAAKAPGPWAVVYMGPDTSWGMRAGTINSREATEADAIKALASHASAGGAGLYAVLDIRTLLPEPTPPSDDDEARVELAAIQARQAANAARLAEFNSPERVAARAQAEADRQEVMRLYDDADEFCRIAASIRENPRIAGRRNPRGIWARARELRAQGDALIPAERAAQRLRTFYVYRLDYLPTAPTAEQPTPAACVYIHGTRADCQAYIQAQEEHSPTFVRAVTDWTNAGTLEDAQLSAEHKAEEFNENREPGSLPCLTHAVTRDPTRGLSRAGLEAYHEREAERAAEGDEPEQTDAEAISSIQAEAAEDDQAARLMGIEPRVTVNAPEMDLTPPALPTREELREAIADRYSIEGLQGNADSLDMFAVVNWNAQGGRRGRLYSTHPSQAAAEAANALDPNAGRVVADLWDLFKPAPVHYAAAIVALYDSASVSDRGYDALYYIERAHAAALEAATVAGNGTPEDLTTPGGLRHIEEASKRARARLAARQDEKDKERARERNATDLNTPEDYLSEALNNTTAEDVAREDFMESVEEIASSRAESASTYYRDHDDILSRYESEFGSEAEDLCDGKTHGPADWQAARSEYAGWVAYCAARSFAAKGVETLREECEALPGRLYELGFMEADDDGKPIGELSVRDIDIEDLDPIGLAGDAALIKPEDGVTFYRGPAGWIAVVELSNGLYASTLGVYRDPDSSDDEEDDAPEWNDEPTPDDSPSIGDRYELPPG